MDYKEKYEALLANIKAYHARFGDTCNLKKELEECVPELRASEDEKNWGQIFACITDDALKEWLEKKKAKIIADLTQTAEEKEYVRTIKSLVADAIRATECVEVKEEVHGKTIAQSGPDTAFYQRLIDWAEGRHIDQTAVWSEADKNWKPSEEQMDALMNMRFAVAKFGPSSSLAALNSLYHDLKKL